MILHMLFSFFFFFFGGGGGGGGGGGCLKVSSFVLIIAFSAPLFSILSFFYFK